MVEREESWVGAGFPSRGSEIFDRERWIVWRDVFLILLLLLQSVPGETGARRHPERIVSLAPNVTEILFALGVGDRVVGVTEYCDEPREARKIPRIGGFTNPNLEVILSRRPDLVIAVPNGGNRQTVALLTRMGVRVLVVHVRRIEEVLEAITTIGTAVGRGEAAHALVREIGAGLDRISAKVSGRKRRKTAVVYGKNPLYLAGPGTFADELITLGGGTNIARDAERDFPTFNFEAFLLRAPEVIIDAAMPSTTEPPADPIAFWRKWPMLPAVAGERVCIPPDDAPMIPGPRLVHALEIFARCIHPEAFSPSEGTTR
ncbi:MAG: cobalamin-binding protein [Deltaproteobacteria bacterium]|nr:MAG: cobalamin-binding protein [Deltaproteobacteria bacterium]